MKNKFEEFYFENDRTYLAEVYWDLYDKDHQAAIKKYEGHMFCPFCRTAPLVVAKGNQRRYFKVTESNMGKHDKDCVYRVERGTKKDTDRFYRDLDKTDIRNRLISCMNRMLKENIDSVDEKRVNAKNKSEYKNDFLNFVTGSGTIKYLPHKSIISKTLAEEMDLQKIYYGKVALYIMEYIPKGEVEVKIHYLKVLHQDSKKQICDISISPKVYNYLEKDFRLIPKEKGEAENFYLCFSGVLETGKYSYRCKLHDSRLIVFEKET